MTYNYKKFKPGYYDLAEFAGPKAGEKFIDFEVYDLKGNKVKLSDYLKSPVVLETGSITCPMYVKGVNKMNKLSGKYNKIKFLVLYVREAHPGKNTPEHNNQINKINQACRTNKLFNEEREIIVDTIHGNAHLTYGAMPNMVYIINTDGIVLFRGDWNNTNKVEEILENLQAQQIIKEEHFEPSKPNPYILFRTLLIGGIDAVWDFIIGLPGLLKLHSKANKRYSE
jgi:hypothetical protein